MKNDTDMCTGFLGLVFSEHFNQRTCTEKSHAYMRTGFHESAFGKGFNAELAMKNHTDMCTGFHGRMFGERFNTELALKKHTDMCTSFYQRAFGEGFNTKLALNNHTNMCTGFHGRVCGEHYDRVKRMFFHRTCTEKTHLTSARGFVACFRQA